MRRIPIRIKLTLAFAAVMAAVLLATGLFLYLRFGSEFDRSVNQGLRTRAGDIQALIKQTDTGLGQAGRTTTGQEQLGFAQVLDSTGHVFDAPPGPSQQPVLSQADVTRALKRSFYLERATVPGIEGSARLLATPVTAQDRRLVVVVGSSLAQREEARSSLGTLLLIGGPIALLLAALAGYGVAAFALRPVESMRRRAEAISSAEPGQRLPVPPARDEISGLGETLNAMLARIEVAFERERSFVAEASHELRTPLAILKAELELALRRGRTPAELTAALRSAAEETDRLAQLAEDLLVLARSDQGRLPVRRERVDVGELLERTRDRYANRAASSGRPLAVELPAGDLTLDADPLRLEQALGNLLDNSLRYGAGPIDLVARPANGALELHVTDSGDGFPDAFLNIAFARFSRADHSRARGGTGLGLAIVQAVAAAHGGRAQAANRPEGGADVWLSVPAGRA